MKTIPGDDNCMFAAVAHQLFEFEIGSTMQVAMTATIREMAVDYLRDHRSDPEIQLLIETRTEEDWQGLEGANEEESIMNCLNVLAQDHEWGAGESLYAISLLFRVKIVIK